MARRTAGKPPCWTPSGRGACRDQLRGSRGGSLALSWAFVLACLALSCGCSDAESEFSILEEAQVLAEQMKKLSSQELGVFTMQVRVRLVFAAAYFLKKEEETKSKDIFLLV